MVRITLLMAFSFMLVSVTPAGGNSFRASNQITISEELGEDIQIMSIVEDYTSFMLNSNKHVVKVEYRGNVIPPRTIKQAYTLDGVKYEGTLYLTKFHYSKKEDVTKATYEGEVLPIE